MRLRLEKSRHRWKGSWGLKAGRHSVHKHQTWYYGSDDGWQHQVFPVCLQLNYFQPPKDKNSMVVASVNRLFLPKGGVGPPSLEAAQLAG